jgi:hypothetical protein
MKPQHPPVIRFDEHLHWREILMNQTFLIPYVSYLGGSDEHTYDIRLIPVHGEFISEFQKAFEHNGVKIVWQQIFDWSTGRPQAQWFIEQVFRILYREAHDTDRAYTEIQRLAEAFRAAEKHK